MIASVVDLKQHLNMTSTTDDDELQLILDAAERVVTSIAGNWGGETVTESVPVVGGTAILSGRPGSPVLSNGLPVGGTVDNAAGLITGLGGMYGSSQRLTVTYSVRGGTVPADILLATLIIAGHLWETQRGTAPSALALQDPNGFGDTTSVGLGFAIPNRAQELLAPYSRPSIA
jgi:hypothetical protein